MEIKKEIEEYADTHSEETIVFLFSASMMSNTLIDQLHPGFKAQHFLIDVGSVFNNFIDGRQNREYMTRFREQWKSQYPQWIK